jgi:phosphoenolpyruvate-protein phosphotransferase
MITVSGKTVHRRLAIGKVMFMQADRPELCRTIAEDAEAELAAYRAAKAEVIARLHALYEEAVSKVGELLAHTFEIHVMMIEDEAYSGMVESMIRNEHVTAAYAVASTGRHYAQMLAQMEDPYFQARSADIREISDRLTDQLLGNHRESAITEPVILMAEELGPGETMQLDPAMILGLVTQRGSENSHAAILARTMDIPAITGVAIREEWDGAEAVLDGENGLLIVDPDEETQAAYEGKIRAFEARQEELAALLPLPSETKAGVKVPLLCNVGCAADAALAAERGADGIGLFRSEYLCLGGEEYPSEEEQLTAYRNVVAMMQGRPVTIRTFDLGADKRAEYLHLPEESNPALGFRAIRISLAEEEPFRAQLRAILRASAFGTVRVLYPMISAEWEIRRVDEIFREEKKRLVEAGVAVGEVERGIMIETPAAAIVCDRLADYVDFFSIGTNDLTQYVLAADRQNYSVAPYYDPHNEAVTRLIAHVVGEAHRKHVSVCVCGELAADVTATEKLLRMGVDALSVAPNSLLAVKRAVRECE